jgi:excisionase family DNA binding protein
MSERPTTALFVRIPDEQARALDRLAFETRRPKQTVVSELLSRAIGDPAPQAPPGRHASGRRVTIEGLPEPAPVVGRHVFRPFESEVLTLVEVAELLAVDDAAVEDLVARGELPGRQIAGEWRFARSAVLAWLAHESPAPARAPAPAEREE